MVARWFLKISTRPVWATHVPNMHQKYRPKRITVLMDTYAGSYAGEVFAMSRTVAHGCVLYRVRPTEPRSNGLGDADEHYLRNCR